MPLAPFILIGFLIWKAVTAVKEFICDLPLVGDVIEGIGLLSCGYGEKTRTTGQTCKSDSDCVNNQCGWDQAGDDQKLICCGEGEENTLYAAYDYCPIADGKPCPSDSTCKSGTCEGNAGGFAIGVCKTKMDIGATCSADDDCKSDHCARTSLGGTYKCVEKSCYCDLHDSGCTPTYWYDAKWNNGKHCVSFDEVAGGWIIDGLEWIGNTAEAAWDYAASIFSDRRLKSNIERMGESPSGIPIYSFQYTGKPQRYSGVMSDDLIRLGYKNAVSKHENGFDMVDYLSLIHI